MSDGINVRPTPPIERGFEKINYTIEVLNTYPQSMKLVIIDELLMILKSKSDPQTYIENRITQLKESYENSSS